jgi:IstB-like ATP binding protein
LILIDDVGLLPVSPDAADALFRVVDAAYERRSIAISSTFTRSKSAQVRVKVWAVVCSAHTFANAAASVSTAPIR